MRRLITDLEVTVHTGTSTASIEADGDRLIAKLANETELDVDLVVFSAGVRAEGRACPRVRAGDRERGGVLVDESCRTSDPAVYAIGECAAVAGKSCWAWM